MFNRCSSFKKLNLSNFNNNKVKGTSGMFYGCSDELRMKVRSQYKNFQEIAFKNNDGPDKN